MKVQGGGVAYTVVAELSKEYLHIKETPLGRQVAGHLRRMDLRQSKRPVPMRDDRKTLRAVLPILITACSWPRIGLSGLNGADKAAVRGRF